MYSDAKNNYFGGKKGGVQKQRLSEKHAFGRLKIIISVKNRGCSKTRQWGNYCIH